MLVVYTTMDDSAIDLTSPTSSSYELADSRSLPALGGKFVYNCFELTDGVLVMCMCYSHSAFIGRSLPSTDVHGFIYIPFGMKTINKAPARLVDLQRL